MAFLQDIWDISIPGQRVNEARDLRAQRAAAEQARQRDAEAFKAIQSGDVMGAATQSPELAGQYQNIAAGEDARTAAQGDRLRAAGLQATRAAKAALTRDPTKSPVQVFDAITQQAGSLFGTPEEMAQVRSFVEQNGPQAFDIIEQTFGEQQSDKGRYISTRGGIFDTQTREIIASPEGAVSDDPLGDLKAENLRSQIAARDALTGDRAAKTTLKEQELTDEQAVMTGAREALSANLADVVDSYLKLDELGAIVSPDRGRVANIAARAQSSATGQFIGGTLGTEAQSVRKRISNIQPLLIQHIRQATGMSARGMDSNRELEFYLQAATDPKEGDIFSNLVAIQVLDSTFGLGGVLENTLPPEVLDRVKSQAANDFRKRPISITRSQLENPGREVPQLSVADSEAPDGVDPADWEYMTADERALFE